MWMQQSLPGHRYVVIIACILLNIHCIKKMSPVQVVYFKDTDEICCELSVIDV